MAHDKKLPASIAMGVSVLAAIAFVLMDVDFTPTHEHGREAVASSTTTIADVIPMATDVPPAQWPTVTLPPYGGVSGHIPIPIGKELVVTGDGVEVHIVFVNGEECVKNSVTNPCPSKADIDHGYIKNVSDETKIPSYAYRYGKT